MNLSNLSLDPDEFDPVRHAVAALPRHEPPPGLRERLLTLVTEEAQAQPTRLRGGRVHQVRIVDTQHGNTRTLRRFEQGTPTQAVPLPTSYPLRQGTTVKHLSGTSNQQTTYFATY